MIFGTTVAWVELSWIKQSPGRTALSRTVMGKTLVWDNCYQVELSPGRNITG